jgi:hypothetical protein
MKRELVSWVLNSKGEREGMTVTNKIYSQLYDAEYTTNAFGDESTVTVTEHIQRRMSYNEFLEFQKGKVKMVLKDLAFAIINGSTNSTQHDQVEAYQFVADNGYWEELTPKQMLFLRDLIETDKVHTPPLMIGLPPNCE